MSNIFLGGIFFSAECIMRLSRKKTSNVSPPNNMSLRSVLWGLIEGLSNFRF